jgi:hypothetical protein
MVPARLSLSIWGGVSLCHNGRTCDDGHACLSLSLSLSLSFAGPLSPLLVKNGNNMVTTVTMVTILILFEELI